MRGFDCWMFFTLINLWQYAGGGPYIWEKTKPQMRLYVLDENQERTSRNVDLWEGLKLFQDPDYDLHKPTLLIVHGWFQGAEDRIIKMLLDSLFKSEINKKMNIMVLDTPWFLDNRISNILYFSLPRKLRLLGNIVAEIFNEAVSKELIKPEDINMLGLSLGAHLSGYISRSIPGHAYSIVGLDPAGIGFNKFPNANFNKRIQHVSKTDAKFVHLYHTDSWSCGTSKRLGTADFEFNPEGHNQPGCKPHLFDPKCSHRRAFYLFNDVILGDKELIALKCGSVEDFENCRCQENPTVVLKYPIDTSAEGNYFLRTEPAKPFGQGQEGIICGEDQWNALQQQKKEEEERATSVEDEERVTDVKEEEKATSVVDE